MLLLLLVDLQDHDFWLDLWSLGCMLSAANMLHMQYGHCQLAFTYDLFVVRIMLLQQVLQGPQAAG
jgi:hypothetical protein